MNKKSKDYIIRLSCMAMLIALEVVLNRFCSINTQFLKIGFGFVPAVMAAYLYGPLPAGIVWGLADFIGANVFPVGAYHPGFTLCNFAMGVIYGIFLHGRKAEGSKILIYATIPAVINSIVFGLLLNTWWVSMLYGSRTYIGWFVYRLPQYAILIPVNILLIPAILRLGKELERYAAPIKVKKAWKLL